MISKDLQNKTMDEIKAALAKAIKAGDSDAFVASFDDLAANISASVRAEYDFAQSTNDSTVLAARGVRQLTSAETTYYGKVIEAMKSESPKQALANLDVVMPETIINTVLDDLEHDHPLLSVIDFMPTNAAITMIMNTNTEQLAVWGPLTSAITKELDGGFVAVKTALAKLTAFIFVAKDMLELGPNWLDNYVRRVLYESLAAGLEYGIVAGTGKNMPIGMNRQVGDNVTVVGGEYPEKTPIKVYDFSPRTMGHIYSLLARNSKGAARRVGGFIMVVNPVDYFDKVMPATTLVTPNGGYTNDVMPFATQIIQSSAVDIGYPIIGIAKQYFGAAGIGTKGRIEYSDEYQFLEDNRVYTVRTYANGMPKDNNSFAVLDITELKQTLLKVEVVDSRPASTDATLSALSVGGAQLNETFEAETITYTADTTASSGAVMAVPADAGANITIKIGNKVYQNGTSIPFGAGDTTVKVEVVAEDNTTKKTYTITVTKE